MWTLFNYGVACLTLDCGWKNSALAALGCFSYNVHELKRDDISIIVLSLDALHRGDLMFGY